MNSVFSLDPRLTSVAEQVRRGAVLADIGTDHAYLPIHLLLTGKINRAIACDIRQGPLDRAKENVAKYALNGKIECRLGDGLSQINAHEITDVAICGMGGEMIVKIIENAEFVKDSDIRLILQPMTHQAHLRKYLLESGFSIIAESLSLADGKIYQCICAEYKKTQDAYTMAELEIGRQKKDDPLLKKLITDKIATLEKIISGKKSALSDICDEMSLLDEYNEMLRLIK
jgi:tRNA (adenine22-N1)-methyltransferase